MFRKTNRRIKELWDYLADNKPVECEVCGCLLRKETAIKGESKILKTAYGTLWGLDVVGQEIIVEQFYCKIHKNKANISKLK